MATTSKRFLRTCSLALVGFTILAASPMKFAVAASDADTPATMSEIQQMADGKQWQPMLQKIGKALALHGDAATQYDRYQLQMLRGEAYLQTRQNSSAVTAFGEAAKEAAGDEKKVAVAAATTAMMKKSSAGMYVRKSPATQPTDPKSIDITDRTLRSTIFAAMAQDDAAVLAPKVKVAVAGQTLNPLFELLKPATELHETELAASAASNLASGGSPTTNPADAKTPLSGDILTSLATHAKEIEAKSITEMKAKVDAIEKNANTLEDHGPIRNGNSRTGYAGTDGPDHRFRKRGLSGTDSQTLRDVMSTAKQLIGASKQFADAFGKELGAQFDAEGKDATDLGTHANDVLRADYFSTTNDPRMTR